MVGFLVQVFPDNLHDQHIPLFKNGDAFDAIQPFLAFVNTRMKS